MLCSVAHFIYSTVTSENCFLKILENSYCNLYASVDRTKERTCKFGTREGLKKKLTLVYSVEFSSNALFISSQARSVPALLKYGVFYLIDYV